MRRAGIALLVVCLLGPGLPARTAPANTPPYRCFLDRRVDPDSVVSDTGVAGLDTRLKAERSFLELLFRVKPELVLAGDSAPRDACVCAGSRVVFKASWLKQRCWDRPHRNARVAAVLAHQYAHVLQARLGCKLPESARELHADLLAGWYLGKRNFGTLGGGAALDAAFAASLFDREDPYLNTRYEHGAVSDRVAAVSEGFRLRREKRLSLERVFAHGLERFPPPSVGYQGPTPAELAKAGVEDVRVEKVACIHEAACHHRVACKHPSPCVHKVACSHLQPCVHRTPCVHRIACTHHVPCVHRTRCQHKVQCVHTTPCVHREHSYDTEHEYDLDPYGVKLPCGHRIRCRHFRHRFDFLHNFDYEHEYDYRHEYDTQHDHDMAHEFDTEHEGDPIHEYDMAHDWDPVHEFDLAHEHDPAHDYDVRATPAWTDR